MAIIKVLAPVLRLKMVSDKNITEKKLGNFTYIINQNKIFDFLGQNGAQILKYNGALFLNRLDEYSAAICSFNLNDFKEDDLDSSLNFESFLLWQHLLLNCHCLWLIKDNSVYVPDVTLSCLDPYYIYTRSSSVYYSTSRGEDCDIEFSPEELQTANNYRKKIESLFRTSFNIFDFKDLSKTTRQPNYLNGIELTNEGRFEKAFRFLTITRTTNFVPLKLIGYMSIFESLFSYDNKDIGKTISRRVTSYLGLKGNSKKRVCKLLLDAYNMRSRFVHGDKLEFTNSHFQEISSEIDQLTRRIFLKLINLDAKLFDLSDTQYNEWLNSLWINREESLPK